MTPILFLTRKNIGVIQDFNFSLTDFNRVLTHCLAGGGVSLFQKLIIKLYNHEIAMRTKARTTREINRWLFHSLDDSII